MRYFILLMGVLVLSCQSDNTPTAPVDTQQLDQFLTNNSATYRSNVVVLISQNQRLVYSKAIGSYTPNTPLPIASASKWLSGAVIMALIDEGKLSLSDSVGKYLPIFTRHRKGSITLRQLFSHTSGFPGNSPQGFEDSKTLTLAQAVDSLAARTALVASPGAAFSYGGVSMHIAGRIAEVVSGKKWQQLFEEKIGIPCAMTKTVYSPLNPNNPLIAGGANSSAQELLNFTEMMVAKGTWNGKRILSETAVQALTSDQTANARIVYTPFATGNPYTPYGPLNPVRYGVGVWLDVVEPQTAQTIECSSPGAFGTHPWINSSQQLAGVLFTFSQGNEANALSLQFREYVRNTFR